MKGTIRYNGIIGMITSRTKSFLCKGLYYGSTDSKYGKY